MENVTGMENPVGAEYIKAAVGDVRALKPEFGLMLDLYERIFIEQENSKSGICLVDPEEGECGPGENGEKRDCLLEVSRFPVDGPSAALLLLKICGILKSADGDVADSEERIAGALDNGSLDAGELFSAYLSKDDSLLAETCERLHVDGDVLSFVILNSLKPSLNVFAVKLSSRLDGGNGRDRGCCPVCGSLPELSVFGEGGNRTLLCGFCGHRWQSKRLFCPYCGNTDHETLRYFAIDGEEEYRVDVCDRCSGYIRTIDVKKTTRRVFLPLESVSTPYIDVRFRDMGYNTGAAVKHR